MIPEISKAVTKFSLLIFIFALIGFIFLNLFPLISITEENLVDTGEDFNLHFNFNMMKKSTDPEINSLIDMVEFIIYGFWAIIIFALLTYFFSIIKASQKYQGYAKTIFIFSITLLIISLVVTMLFFLFIYRVNGMHNIYNSSLFSPIYFIYLPLIFCLICVLYSGLFLKVSVPAFKKEKESVDEKLKKPIKKKPKQEASKQKKIEKKAVLKQKEPIPKKPDAKKTVMPINEDKRDEMEKWLSDELENIDKSPEPAIESEPSEEDIEKNNEEPKKSESEPFITNQQKESKEDSTEEITPTKSFEEALQTAIQRKQTGATKEINIPADKESNELSKSEPLNEESTQDNALGTNDNKNDSLKIKQQETQSTDSLDSQLEKTPIKKEAPNEELNNQEKPKTENKDMSNQESKKEEGSQEIKVRCPQCKHIFSALKTGDVIKIKCPECGKEGIAK